MENDGAAGHLEVRGVSPPELSRGLDELIEAKQGLEVQVTNRTSELQLAKAKLEEQVKELGTLNHVMFGREERVLELKEQIRSLKAQLGINTNSD